MNPDKSEVISSQSFRTRSKDIHVRSQAEATKVILLGVVIDAGDKFDSIPVSVAKSVKGNILPRFTPS